MAHTLNVLNKRSKFKIEKVYKIVQSDKDKKYKADSLDGKADDYGFKGLWFKPPPP